MANAMKLYAKDALEIQDACNPVALVTAWAAHLKRWDECGYRGWDDVCKDAPFILFVDKLNDMAGRPDLMDFSKAWDTCTEVSNGQV